MKIFFKRFIKDKTVLKVYLFIKAYSLPCDK